MALILMEGFDDNLQQFKGWSQSLYSDPGRFGGASYRVLYATSYTFADPITDTVTIGMAISKRTNTIQPFLTVGNLTVKFQATGEISVHRADTDAQVALTTDSYWATTGIWRYIEAQYSPTTGDYEVRVDTTTALAGVVPSTLNIPMMHLGATSSGGYQVDDLYVVDGTGGDHNTFLGDTRIQTLYPTGDGSHTAMTPSTGTAHYAVVDEPGAPNTTDYLSTSAIGTKETFNYTDLSSNTAAVHGVQVTTYARKDATGQASIRALARVGGVDYSGSAAPVMSASWTGNKELWPKSPGTSSDWTPSEVNNSEFGVETV